MSSEISKQQQKEKNVYLACQSSVQTYDYYYPLHVNRSNILLFFMIIRIIFIIIVRLSQTIHLYFISFSIFLKMFRNEIINILFLMECSGIYYVSFFIDSKFLLVMSFKSTYKALWKGHHRKFIVRGSFYCSFFLHCYFSCIFL